jgi:lipopolysaccharide export LptBFGC system permease protein LptF
MSPHAMASAILAFSYFDLALPVAVLVFIIVGVLRIHFRQGRSEVLEQWIAQGKCGPIFSFEGTLTVEQASQGFLRLTKTAEAGRLQFKYRWLSAIREQSDYDEVTFDIRQHLVELKRKNKVTRLPCGNFSAIRMREISQENSGSLWHFDLLARDGKYVMFVSSARGNRRVMFENSAGLAKTISDITTLPAHVVLSGNVWSSDWPPEASNDA